MEKDDRITNTANILMSGAEVRKMRAVDLSRWKRRLHRSIEAQMYNLEGANTLDEMYPYWVAQNEAYKMCLKIINAKWKNV